MPTERVVVVDSPGCVEDIEGILGIDSWDEEVDNCPAGVGCFFGIVVELEVDQSCMQNFDKVCFVVVGIAEVGLLGTMS